MITLAASLVATVVLSQPQTLKLNPPTNKTLTYQRKSAIEVDFDGAPVPIEITNETKFSLEFLKVSSKEIELMEIILADVSDMPGSAQLAESPPSLVGQTEHKTITPQGEFVSSKITKAADQSQSGVQRMKSKDTGYLGLIYPSNLIAVGDSWTHKTKLKDANATDTETFTLKEIKTIDGKKVAVITSTFQSSRTRTAKSPSGDLLIEIKTKGKGTYTVNMSDGIILSTTSQSTAEIDTGVSIQNQTNKTSNTLIKS